MRNPIQPSPDRPIPLPDRILMDAWWVDLKAETKAGSGVPLRIVTAQGEVRLEGRSMVGAPRS